MNNLTRWVGNYYSTWHAAIECKLNDLGYTTRDDRGAVSTETAIIVGFLAAAAAAGGLIIIAKAKSNADNIPDQISPPGG